MDIKDNLTTAGMQKFYCLPISIGNKRKLILIKVIFYMRRFITAAGTKKGEKGESYRNPEAVSNQNLKICKSKLN